MKQLESYQLYGTLTLLADEKSCCPGNTAICQVLLHNLSGQLYSNLLVLGGLVGEETSFQATLFNRYLGK